MANNFESCFYFLLGYIVWLLLIRALFDNSCFSLMVILILFQDGHCSCLFSYFSKSSVSKSILHKFSNSFSIILRSCLQCNHHIIALDHYFCYYSYYKFCWLLSPDLLSYWFLWFNHCTVSNDSLYCGWKSGSTRKTEPCHCYEDVAVRQDYFKWWREWVSWVGIR